MLSLHFLLFLCPIDVGGLNINLRMRVFLRTVLIYVFILCFLLRGTVKCICVYIRLLSMKLVCVIAVVVSFARQFLTSLCVFLYRAVDFIAAVILSSLLPSNSVLLAIVRTCCYPVLYYISPILRVGNLFGR